MFLWFYVWSKDVNKNDFISKQIPYGLFLFFFKWAKIKHSFPIYS